MYVSQVSVYLMIGRDLPAPSLPLVQDAARRVIEDCVRAQERRPMCIAEAAIQRSLA
jgi:hypothetical protein